MEQTTEDPRTGAARSPGQGLELLLLCLFTLHCTSRAAAWPWQDSPGNLPPACIDCLQPSNGHSDGTYYTVLFAGAEVVVFRKYLNARGPRLGQCKAQGEMDMGWVVKVGDASTRSVQSQELCWQWDRNMSKRLSHKEPFKSLKGLSCQAYRIISLRIGCNQEL